MSNQIDLIQEHLYQKMDQASFQTSHSSEIGTLIGALAKAQSRITSAIKDKKNPFFKSNYADLASIWDCCREPLSSNGLAIIQTVEGKRDEMYLITLLGHASGQWIKSKLPMLLVKHDPQGQGSAITYARRYALQAIVGVCADDDDDGEKAMARERKKEEELGEKEIAAFFNNFEEEKDIFRKYMDAISSTRKWSISKTIIEYQKNPERVRKSFDEWKAKMQTPAEVAQS